MECLGGTWGTSKSWPPTPLTSPRATPARKPKTTRSAGPGSNSAGRISLIWASMRRRRKTTTTAPCPRTPTRRRISVPCAGLSSAPWKSPTRCANTLQTAWPKCPKNSRKRAASFTTKAMWRRTKRPPNSRSEPR